MKNVLIVSPHFPPTNAADHHRVRMALPYLEQFGWRPTILALEPDSVDAEQDTHLARCVPYGIDVVRCAVPSSKLLRTLGVRSIQYRSIHLVASEGSRLLRERKFDVIFFSTTLFLFMALGPYWKRSTGVPYVLDFQDPWLSDYYRQHKDVVPPGGPFKYGLSNRLAKVLEPFAVRGAAQTVCVSSAYAQMLLFRYPSTNESSYHTLPFGGSERDFEVLETAEVRQNVFSPQDGFTHWVYVGRGGPDMAFALRSLFSAIQRRVHDAPEWGKKIRLHFIGTDYAAPERARRSVAPLAAEYGLDEIVSEITTRLPYFQTLRCLRDAHALIIPGSDDPSYTASKLYPYILARKPLLAVFHRSSSVIDVLRHTRAGIVVTFDGQSTVENVADEIYKSWLMGKASGTCEVDWAAFEPYTAREMTRKLCDIFDRAITRPNRLGETAPEQIDEQADLVKDR